MARVADVELRVMGVRVLRVVDANVSPCPVGTHYQVVTYAVAERAAEMIVGAWEKGERGEMGMMQLLIALLVNLCLVKDTQLTEIFG